MIFKDVNQFELCYDDNMTNYVKKIFNCILVFGLTTMILSAAFTDSMVTKATTIKEIQDKIKREEEELKNKNNQISSLEDEQDLIEEQISDLNAEIINTMASISLKEDEIAEKEAEIEIKVQQIADTEKEYYAAVEREEQQRSYMAESTRMMYEHDDVSYLTAILKGKGLSEILNQLDYIERVYEYSMGRLDAFIEVKEEVHNLWDRLEEEKRGLDEDREGLEADRQELNDLKADLDSKLARKKQESANYDAEISKAKQEAAVAKKLLEQDKKKLTQLQKAQNAANKTYVTTNYTATIDAASGSDLGKKIAKYGCQYIGNPYVMGGTSLTQGADCSGFTYKIYQDFGYSIPRTSYQQRSAGTGVEYANAQPGDLICYDGHVGLYIGGGMIVHASNAKSGIKVSNAQYRTILAVRRIL